MTNERSKSVDITRLDVVLNADKSQYLRLVTIGGLLAVLKEISFSRLFQERSKQGVPTNSRLPGKCLIIIKQSHDATKL